MGEAIVAGSLIVGALVIASIPVIKLIGMWLEGEIDPTYAMFGIVLYMFLIAGVMGAPSAGKIVLILFILASAVFMPQLMQASDTIQNTRMEDAKLTMLQQSLERNTMDAPSRMELARMLYKKGDLDQAIEQMEWTLNTWPGLGLRIKPQLESWKREKERQGIPPPIFCHRCNAENAWNATQCIACEARFGTRAAIQHQVEREGGPKRVIKGWIIVASLANIICFSLLVLMRFMPIEIVGVVIIASTIVAAWLFLRWVGGDMGSVGN